jgi:hypothetical protein
MDKPLKSHIPFTYSARYAGEPLSRLTVHATRRQREALGRLAEARNVSACELAREAVTRWMEDVLLAEQWTPPTVTRGRLRRAEMHYWPVPVSETFKQRLALAVHLAGFNSLRHATHAAISRYLSNLNT